MFGGFILPAVDAINDSIACCWLVQLQPPRLPPLLLHSPPWQVLPSAGAACEGRMLVHHTRAERTEQQAEGCGT